MLGEIDANSFVGKRVNVRDEVMSETSKDKEESLIAKVKSPIVHPNYKVSNELISSDELISIQNLGVKDEGAIPKQRKGKRLARKKV
ncbi:hypothetical protein ACOSP7_012050 [Xanthoceras sorbifolium]